MNEAFFGSLVQGDKKIQVIPHELRRRTKFITYIPFDGSPIFSPWLDQLQVADASVFCSRFAMNEVKDRRSFIRSKYIPHGVDTKAFSPITEQERKEYRSKLPLKENAFLIGMVARNQARKDYPQLFRAIKLAADKIPGLQCLCHCLVRDQGWDLQDLAKQIGIADRIIFNQSLTAPNSGVSEEEMRLLYGSLDLFVLATQGEGFGIPIVEAMACGVPVLTNDYAAGREMVEWSGGGELLKSEMTYYRGGDHNICRPITSEKDIADRLYDLYKNPEKREKYGKAGRAFVEKEISWEKVVEGWKTYLKDIVFPPHDAIITAKDMV